MVFSNISTNNKLKSIEDKQDKLESQQIALVTSANQSLMALEQAVTDLQTENEELRQTLIDAGIIEVPATPYVPEDGASEGSGSVVSEESAAPAEPGQTEVTETTTAPEGGTENA